MKHAFKIVVIIYLCLLGSYFSTAQIHKSHQYLDEKYTSYYNEDSSIITRVYDCGDTILIEVPSFSDFRKSIDVPFSDSVKHHVTIIPDEPKYKPHFNGNLEKYIKENLEYPQEAIDKGIEGTVAIKFYVTSVGNVVEAQVFKGVHELIDNAALRLVKYMPPWKPAINYHTQKPGKRVWILHITFDIEEYNK